MGLPSPLSKGLNEASALANKRDPPGMFRGTLRFMIISERCPLASIADYPIVFREVDRMTTSLRDPRARN
jgi:hypothetical protein